MMANGQRWSGRMRSRYWRSLAKNDRRAWDRIIYRAMMMNSAVHPDFDADTHGWGPTPITGDCLPGRLHPAPCEEDTP